MSALVYDACEAEIPETAEQFKKIAGSKRKSKTKENTCQDDLKNVNILKSFTVSLLALRIYLE